MNCATSSAVLSISSSDRVYFVSLDSLVDVGPTYVYSVGAHESWSLPIHTTFPNAQYGL